jgi:hypothetical protein
LVLHRKANKEAREASEANSCCPKREVDQYAEDVWLKENPSQSQGNFEIV